jgi:hypothetical protein
MFTIHAVNSKLHPTDAENPFKNDDKLLGTAGGMLMFSEVCVCWSELQQQHKTCVK